MEHEQFTRYEISRILGARALQIAMNAPLLIKISKEELEKVRYDPLSIAEIEFESGILPISVHRPFPEKREEKLKREKIKDSDKEVEEAESVEEKDIVKEGEMMELATPEDEQEDIGGESDESAGSGEAY